MKSDPTIEAIREVRHQISKSVNHDAKKLVEHYRKLQERHLERIVFSSDANVSRWVAALENVPIWVQTQLNS